MNICIAHITTLLIIAGMLFAGCDTTPQATDEPPREEHLPPSVKVPKGIEKPDPSEKPDLLDTSVAFPALSTFRKIFGAPHILEDGVCYYMGTAKTDGTLMMLLFIEDTIIASQTLTYKQDVLYTYIPLLIESLQNEDKAVAKQALKFLTDVRRQIDTTTENIPFEKFPSVWNENTYQHWKKWWNTTGEKDYQRSTQKERR